VPEVLIDRGGFGALSPAVTDELLDVGLREGVRLDGSYDAGEGVQAVRVLPDGFGGVAPCICDIA